MLASQHRFHGLGSLNYVYRHGQTARGPFMSLKFALNNRRPTWRAVIVVSRKVSKSAVVRNRIRRRIYEIIRLESEKINGPYDIIVLVFSDEVAGLEHEKLRKLVTSQLKRASITTSN